MISVNANTMRQIAPRFSGTNGARQAAIIDSVGAVLQATLERYQISSRLRIAHFLAQTCQESAGFRTTEEFADGSAYNGRTDLGNTQPGDGPRFKGRGLLQLTGRANYQVYGAALGIDLINDPKRAADPPTSLAIACEYWKQRKINPMCDNDDLLAVTRAVNGGLNGLNDRAAFLKAAKAALADAVADQIGVAASSDTHPVLRRGEHDQDVASLQALLRKLDFDIAIDGDFGAATELAVKLFQTRNGLAADGIVGPATWARLAPT